MKREENRCTWTDGWKRRSSVKEVKWKEERCRQELLSPENFHQSEQRQEKTGTDRSYSHPTTGQSKGKRGQEQTGVTLTRQPARAKAKEDRNRQELLSPDNRPEQRQKRTGTDRGYSHPTTGQSKDKRGQEQTGVTLTRPPARGKERDDRNRQELHSLKDFHRPEQRQERTETDRSYSHPTTGQSKGKRGQAGTDRSNTHPTTGRSNGKRVQEQTGLTLTRSDCPEKIKTKGG